MKFLCTIYFNQKLDSKWLQISRKSFKKSLINFYQMLNTRSSQMIIFFLILRGSACRWDWYAGKGHLSNKVNQFLPVVCSLINRYITMVEFLTIGKSTLKVNNKYPFFILSRSTRSFVYSSIVWWGFTITFVTNRRRYLVHILVNCVPI